MSPETLARVFDPFFTTKSPGRGLGLSALLGIVRSHCGAVQIVSKQGQGSVFTVLLPASGRPVRRPPPPKPRVQPMAGATVLVVDDEEDIREVVQAVLESRGLHVLTAKDGYEGLDQFRRHADAIDVVLLDMTMPGMSGEAVFREILALRPQTRVILSSGYSEQESLARLEQGRMAAFVHKPYTAQMLVDSVGAALRPRVASAAGGPVARDEPAQPPRCSTNRT